MSARQINSALSNPSATSFRRDSVAAPDPLSTITVAHWDESDCNAFLTVPTSGLKDTMIATVSCENVPGAFIRQPLNYARPVVNTATASEAFRNRFALLTFPEKTAASVVNLEPDSDAT